MTLVQPKPDARWLAGLADTVQADPSRLPDAVAAIVPGRVPDVAAGAKSLCKRLVDPFVGEVERVAQAELAVAAAAACATAGDHATAGRLFAAADVVFRSVSPEHRGRGDCLLQLAEAHAESGDWVGANAAIDQAVRVFDRHNDTAMLADALLRRAAMGVLRALDPDESAVQAALADLGRVAAELANHPELGHQRAQALWWRGNLRGRYGDADSAVTDLDAAAPLFEQAGRTADAGRVRRNQGEWLALNGEPDKAIRSLTEAERLLDGQSDPAERAAVARAIGLVAEGAGNGRTALAALRRAVALDPNAGLPPFAQPHMPPLMEWIEAGRFATAAVWAEYLTGLIGKGAPVEVRALPHHALGLALASLGEMADAIAPLRVAADAFRLTGADALLPIAVWNLGRALLVTDQFEEAVACFREAEPSVAVGPDAAAHRMLRGRAELALAEHSARSGNEADILGLLSAAEPALRAANDKAFLGRSLTARGDALLDRNEFENALAAFDEAIPLLTGHPDHAVMLARAYRGRGRVRHVGLPQDARKEALADLDEAVRIIHGTAASAHTRANYRSDRAASLFQLGRYPEAIRECAEIVPILDAVGDPEVAITRMNWALGLHMTGGHLEALDLIDRAIEDARRAGLARATVHCLAMRGVIRNQTGDYANALDDARAAVEGLTPNDPPMIHAMARLGFGGAQIGVGAYSEGLATLEASLGVCDAAGPSARGIGALRIGQAHMRLGQVAEAERWYAVAVPLLKEAGMAEAHGNALLAEAHHRREVGDLDAAAAVIRSAIPVLEECRPGSLAIALQNLGFVEVERGRFAAAVEPLRRGIEAFERGGHKDGADQCRRVLALALSEVGGRAEAFELYRGLGTDGLTGEALYRHHVGYGAFLLDDPARLDEALNHLRAAARAYGRARREAGGFDLALEYFERNGQTFVTAAVVALARGQFELAFELAQEGKGALARDLADPHRDFPRMETPELLAARARVVAQLRAAHRGDPDLGRTGGVEGLRGYVSAVRAARPETAPRPAAPLEAEPGAVLDAVSRALPPAWALLDFYQTADDELRVFVVRGDRGEGNFRSLRLPLSAGPRPLGAQLERLRVQLADPSYRPEGWDERIWDDLYTAVFHPLIAAGHLDGCEGLYLVPGGAWHGVPLHAARFVDGRRQSFLAERFAVAYLPSAAALPHLPRPTRPTRCLSLANPERGSANTLPFADWEAEQVRAAFDSAGEFYAGPAATAGRTRSWGGADCLHFACHGAGDAAFAGLSRLYLADDCLLAHDVLHRRDPLRAGSVVLLSGCQTGVKDGRAVNESMGLMTAFLLRGAGAVMATQWNISDTFAAVAVSHLARQLVAGRAVADVLRMWIADARKMMTPDALRTARDWLEKQFPAEEYSHEAEKLAAAYGRASPAHGPGPIRRVPSDPLVWAAFQVYGRVL